MSAYPRYRYQGALDLGDPQLSNGELAAIRQRVSGIGRGQRLRVAARDLRPGDIVRPTNRIVDCAPQTGARTPSGKIELSLTRLKRPEQGSQVVAWNARTVITVDRWSVGA